MENRRGSGIFLGVVSVATLVVAIIGATFAYFSASVNSAEDAINVTAYEFDADIQVRPVYAAQTGEAKNLIPLSVGDANATLLHAINKAYCVDKNNYQACAVYEITITNHGTSAITLDGSLQTILNGNADGTKYFTDLTYQELTGTPATDVASEEDPENIVHTDGTFTLDGAAIPLYTGNKAVMTKEDRPAPIELDTVTLAAAGDESGEDVEVFYAVVYLNEATADTNQDAQMGVTYNGQFVYTSTDGNGKITATFTM